MNTHTQKNHFIFVAIFVFLVMGMKCSFAQTNLVDESRHTQRLAKAREVIGNDIQIIQCQRQALSGSALKELSQKLRRAYVQFGYDSLPLDMRRTFLDTIIDPNDQKSLIDILRKELKSDTAENRVWAAELLTQRLMDSDSVSILKDIYGNGWLLGDGSRCLLTPLERFKVAAGTASIGLPVDLTLLEEIVSDPEKGFELDSLHGFEMRLYALLGINAGRLEMRDDVLDTALRDSNPTFAFYAFSSPTRNRTTLAAATFQLSQIAEGRYRDCGKPDMILALLIRVNTLIHTFAREEKPIFESFKKTIRESVFAILNGKNDSWREVSAGLLRYVCGPGDLETIKKFLKDPSDEITQAALQASISLSIEERKTIHPDLLRMLSSLPTKNPLLFQRIVHRIRDDIGLKVEKEPVMETYRHVLEAVQKQ